MGHMTDNNTQLIIDALNDMRGDLRQLRQELASRQDDHDAKDDREHRELRDALAVHDRRWSRVAGWLAGTATAGGGIGAVIAKLLGGH
jgi:hypothetical protein